MADKVKKEELPVSLDKGELEAYNLIKDNGDMSLAICGDNDVNGNQIFTPLNIVSSMVETVGDEILDFSKTVLEPTSGDGAFTTYILLKRLETIKDNFEDNSLKALSTIYSVEMDKDLIDKQRNNIYSLICKYIKDHNLEVNESYFVKAKCIIACNYMWAMFNTNADINPCFIPLFGLILRMYPDREGQEGNPKDIIKMPVWSIDNGTISMHREDLEAA